MKGLDAYFAAQLNRHQSKIDAIDAAEHQKEIETMNHTESAYIEAGRKYEKATNPDKARAQAQTIRAMLSSEHPRDTAEARALIERGRAEARGTA